MSAAVWTSSYLSLIARLPDLAATARLTLGGFSACTDVYLSLQATLDLLRRGAVAGSPAPKMLDELERRALSGIGGELAVDWPDGPAWMDGLVSGRRGVGGTSLQASQMLAMLGAPAMAALEDRSAGQLAVIHPSVLVATARVPVPRSEIEANGSGRSPHYIFEYTAGQSIGGRVVPRSSRTIVRFDHHDLQHDGHFDRLSVELARTAGAGIICGFNEAPPEKLAAEIDYAVGMAGEWREAGLSLVHLELGDFADDAHRRLTIEHMMPEVSSAGMSLSELNGIVDDEPQPEAAAILLAEAFELERVCVHADDWAMAVTRNDPERELEALQAGCLLASSRAAAGDFTVPRQLPDSACFRDPPLPRSSPAPGGWSIVCCPAPYLEKPAATIGLGDTFLAGTLLVLGRAKAPAHPATITQRSRS
jgi:ADP-dependent phosphofructokinase/glucokinase